MRKLAIFFIMIITLSQSVYADSYYAEYNEPPVSYAIVKANVSIKLPEGEINDTLFCNGRLSVPLAEGVRLMGGSLKSLESGYNINVDGINCFLSGRVNGNRPVIFVYNNREYVSLYNIIDAFGYELLVDTEKNSAEVMKEACQNIKELDTAVTENNKEAYLRLEDITADGMKPGTKGNYTVDMLEKLRYTAEYLYDKNHQFYISWIPVYACPAENYWNDVSKDFNLYNSYFLYVLDYMVDHGGHLGLHGYTHQYGNEESGVGYEWGKDTLYGINEQSERMVLAKTVCRKLGYIDEFFEFPHYGATNEQMLMAEYYFDAVYQSYPDNKYTNNLTYTTRSGKKVYYIPTPADYVHFKRDAGIFERIKNSVDNGYTLSLFYHPVIDEAYIKTETKDNTRVWSYLEEGSLCGIVNYITELGYKFTCFR